MLCGLSLLYKKCSLDSDKYNHNKVKHPLDGLILNTDDEIFLHLIIIYHIQEPYISQSEQNV